MPDHCLLRPLAAPSDAPLLAEGTRAELVGRALVRTRATGEGLVVHPAEGVPPCRAVCFDMDATLLGVEVADYLAERLGLGGRIADLTERAMTGREPFAANYRRRLALLRGACGDFRPLLAELCAALPAAEGLECLTAELRRRGIRTAIVSGGVASVAEALRRRFGIDEAYTPAAAPDGLPDAAAPAVDAAAKARILRAICRRSGIAPAEMWAVGDGANDRPMLEAAGLSVAFRARGGGRIDTLAEWL